MKAITKIPDRQDPERLQGKFEEQYIRLRGTEGRLYTDEVVKHLPYVGKNSPLKREWKLRGQSARRLFFHLAKKKQHQAILEVGCGNGWLSNFLSEIPGAKITGTDINATELNQAARVFNKYNLHFIHTDIRSGELADEKFDVIIFAASIQYFSSLDEILGCAFELLKPGGEIHILDSFFYGKNQVGAAQKRTNLYYESLGMIAFCKFYFHHSEEELGNYNPALMYKPVRWKNLFFIQNPFPWYCIKK